MLRAARDNLKFPHAGGKTTVLRVGFVFGTQDANKGSPGGGSRRSCCPGAALCLIEATTQQPNFVEGHESIYMFGAGDHLVNSPTCDEGRRHPLRVSQLGLPEANQYFR